MRNSFALQIRLLAVALFSLLLTGMIALYLLDSVRRTEDAASGELQQLLQAALSVEQAHTQFKLQVQEWKNVLLRGNDPQAYDKYLASFKRQTERVQELLGRARSVFDGNGRQRFEALLAQHQALVDTYLQALAVTKPDKPAAVEKLDYSLRGVDRPLDAAFPELTQYLAKTVKNKLQANNRAQAEAYRKHRRWIGICIGVSAILIVWSFLIGVKAPSR
ncbi:MAG: hypothetical protein ACU837_08240 [Gammaproteobacteria bacterium]